jgi:hypothetical protein
MFSKSLQWQADDFNDVAEPPDLRQNISMDRQAAGRTASEGRPGQHRRSVDPVEPVAVRLAGSKDYASWVEICSVQ